MEYYKDNQTNVQIQNIKQITLIFYVCTLQYCNIYCELQI